MIKMNWIQNKLGELKKAKPKVRIRILMVQRVKNWNKVLYQKEKILVIVRIK